MRRVLIVLAFLAGLGACSSGVEPEPPCVIWNPAQGTTAVYASGQCPVAPK